MLTSNDTYILTANVAQQIKICLDGLLPFVVRVCRARLAIEIDHHRWSTIAEYPLGTIDHAREL